MKQLITRSKLPNVGTTIFTVMSELAVQHNAINLGQGFPDFPMDEMLTECVAKAMRDNLNQYTHMNGYPNLRERLAEKIHTLYATQIDPNKNITITPGATYALYTALTAIIHPGDEVIVFSPAYDSYIPNIEINGGRAIEIPLTFPEYKINWQLVKDSITDKTRVIIINTPHNPTGTVLDESDMKMLESLLADTNIILISDEVYEHVVFDDTVHHSSMKYPSLFERTLAVYSFGKVYSCTGWKLGYIVGPEHLMQEFRKVHQFNCFTCNTPMQVGIAEYLSKSDAHTQLGKNLQDKRDKLLTCMKATRFKPLKSSGSYFQLYSYEGISNEPENMYASTLVKTARVATIPVSAFYQTPTNNNVLRFCFSKKDEVLEEAAFRLSRI